MTHPSRGFLLGSLLGTALLASCALSPPAVWPAGHAAAARDEALEARVATLVSGMTLEQKVGQMTQAEIAAINPAEVTRFHVGSVLNGGGSTPHKDKHASAATWLALAQDFHAASLAGTLPVKVPLIWGTDAVHGHNNVVGATLFPHHIGLGAANDPALTQEIGVATARAVRATGIGWVFAPTVAVARDDRWGRTYESFSEDPSIVAPLAAAMVRGLQQGLGGERGVVATAKHYVGDGGTDGGRDQGIATVPEADLLRLHAAGHLSALAAGAQTVMASFHSWRDPLSGIDHGKVHGSHYLLTTVLKDRLGFDGFVVSDWNGIGQVPGCTNASCARAILAGVDMVMVPTQWREFIATTLDDVRGGRIPMARIDDAVSRILRVKLRAGLFERSPAQAPGAGQATALQARELARRAVRESLVLLKHDRAVLPLQRGQRVLVVGKSADRFENQVGGWSLSWQGSGNRNTDFPVGDTVLAGLRAALGEARVQFSETTGDVDVRAFDAVVAVVGETPYAEGNGDIPPSGTLRHSSRHPEDLAVLQRVAGRGVPVVTVFLSGRPLHVNDLLNLSDAFVAAWLPGTEGAGIADLLVRAPEGAAAHDFRGRLPFSWPRSDCQTPLNAGDGGAPPLFPLGHGLRLADRTILGPLDTGSTRGGCGAAAEMSIFNGTATAPYGLYVGSPAGRWPDAEIGNDPQAVVAVPAGQPEIRVSTVQMHTQHDARRVSWLGPARWFAWSAPRASLNNYNDGALVFDLQVLEPAQAPVRLTLECGRPCAASLDVSRLFASAAARRTVKIPLACLAARGLDLARVDVPFSLTTTAPLTAAFSRIRIVAGAASDADASSCADLPGTTAP